MFMRIVGQLCWAFTLAFYAAIAIVKEQMRESASGHNRGCRRFFGALSVSAQNFIRDQSQ